MRSDLYPIEIDGQKYHVDKNFNSSPAIIALSNPTLVEYAFFRMINFLEGYGAVIFAKSYEFGTIKIVEDTYEVICLNDMKPAIYDSVECLVRAMIEHSGALFSDDIVIILARRG